MWCYAHHHLQTGSSKNRSARRTTAAQTDRAPRLRLLAVVRPHSTSSSNLCRPAHPVLGRGCVLFGNPYTVHTLASLHPVGAVARVLQNGQPTSTPGPLHRTTATKWTPEQRA
mgnify:CR=1 FL=1